MVLILLSALRHVAAEGFCRLSQGLDFQARCFIPLLECGRWRTTSRRQRLGNGMLFLSRAPKITAVSLNHPLKRGKTPIYHRTTAGAKDVPELDRPGSHTEPPRPWPGRPRHFCFHRFARHAAHAAPLGRPQRVKISHFSHRSIARLRSRVPFLETPCRHSAEEAMAICGSGA